MRGSRYIFKSEDYRDISAVKWIPDENIEIIGAVQICHGMAEHIGCYEEFAQFLNGKGFVVIGNDHRGHGKSLETDGDTGIFSEENGWEKTLNDMRKVTKQLMDQHRNLPIFLIAHSMGSLFARDYISKWGSDLSGVILSATPNYDMLTVNLFKFLAYMEVRFKGLRHRSTFFDNLNFKTFNKPYEPGAPTAYEWLSRDREKVDKYVADPLCGFVCTSSFFLDSATGAKKVSSNAIYKQIPEDLPIFLYYGEDDPVCLYGKTVKQVYEKYRKAGIKDLIMDNNPEGRHESLNEINREDIYNIFLDWMKIRIPQK